MDDVRCLDCNAIFSPGLVDRDVNRPPGDGNRVLMIWMPEVCPNCHNLKAVPESRPSGG